MCVTQVFTGTIKNCKKNLKLSFFDQKLRLICVSFEYYFQQSYWRWENPVVCRQHVKALLDVEYRSGMCHAAAEYWGSMEAYWAGGSLQTQTDLPI